MRTRLMKEIGALIVGVIMMPQLVVAQEENQNDSTQNAQVEQEEQKPQKDIARSEHEEGTIGWHFDELARVSTAYKEDGKMYRVVSYDKYLELQQHVSDSLKVYYTQEQRHAAETEEVNARYEAQAVELKQMKQRVEKVQKAENSVKLFGSYVPMARYQVVVWLVILVLIVLLVVVFLMFKRGHVQVKEVNKNLQELQEEYENHRKNALVREQKLARELMDVKIKNNLI